MNHSPPPVTVLPVAGLQRPVAIAQITDAHLGEIDDRDLPEIQAVFGAPSAAANTRRLAAAVQRVNAIEVDFVACTGDLMHAPTQRNLDIARETLIGGLRAPVRFAIGNHDWQSPVPPHDQRHWQGVFAELFGHPVDWHVEHHAGAAVLFLDDSARSVTTDQLARTRALLDEGRPTLIFMHIPLHLPTLEAAAMKAWPEFPVLLAPNRDASDTLRKAWPLEEHPDDPVTIEFRDLLRTHPSVRAIVSGHIHVDHQDQCPNSAIQYTTQQCFTGGLRIFNFLPA